MEKAKYNIHIVSDDVQEEIIKDLYHQVKNDPEANKLLEESNDYEFVFRNSFVTLMNYLNDKKICVDCEGFAHCKKIGKKGYKIKLKNNLYSNNLETQFVPCEFYKTILNNFNRIVFSDTDKWKIYHHALESKNILVSGKAKVKDSYLYTVSACGNKIKTFNSADENKGYLISSDNHNGEAIGYFLAYFFAKNNRTVSVIEANETLNDCSSLIENIKKDGESNLELAKKADVMIIIDLGFEYKSQAARDLILTPLLMDRAKRGKMTFITSYLDYEDVLSTYAKDKVSRKLFTKILDKIVEPITINDLEYFND